MPRKSARRGVCHLSRNHFSLLLKATDASIIFSLLWSLQLFVSGGGTEFYPNRSA